MFEPATPMLLQISHEKNHPHHLSHPRPAYGHRCRNHFWPIDRCEGRSRSRPRSISRTGERAPRSLGEAVAVSSPQVLEEVGRIFSPEELAEGKPALSGVTFNDAFDYKEAFPDAQMLRFTKPDGSTAYVNSAYVIAIVQESEKQEDKNN